MITLNWRKNPNGDFYPLFDYNFNGLNYSGVYIIWSPMYDKRTLRVGQGNPLSGRIPKYQSDDIYKEINREYDSVLITWAAIHESYLDGVEAYLGAYYQPQFSERFPDVPLISVNFPK